MELEVCWQNQLVLKECCLWVAGTQQLHAERRTLGAGLHAEAEGNIKYIEKY
jgi:hypothetical protein